jgi:hypothetical protein
VQNPGVLQPIVEDHSHNKMPASNVEQVTEQDRSEAAENEGHARAKHQDDV